MVKAIDDNRQLILVHFEGWNSRWDEWISVSSHRIKRFCYGSDAPVHNVIVAMSTKEQIPLCNAQSCEYYNKDNCRLTLESHSMVISTD
jgi:hypothetical protein